MLPIHGHTRRITKQNEHAKSHANGRIENEFITVVMYYMVEFKQPAIEQNDECIAGSASKESKTKAKCQCSRITKNENENGLTALKCASSFVSQLNSKA